MASRQEIILNENLVIECTKIVRQVTKMYQKDDNYSSNRDYWDTYKVNLMQLARAVADAIKVMPCHTTKDCPPPDLAGELLVAAERERCAKVVEQTDPEGGYVPHEDGGSVWKSDAEATLSEAVRRIRSGVQPE